MSYLPEPSRLQPQSLNGYWEFKLDPDNLGQEQNWPENENLQYDLTAPVPGVWQVVEPNYEGVAWYRREVVLPQVESTGKRWIHFHAVDYTAKVWLAGRFLGEHEGGYTPFILQVPSDLPAGEPLPLVVRVSDPPSDNVTILDEARFSEIPGGKQTWYHQASGIWQEVDLFCTGPAQLADPFFRPNLAQGCFDFELEVAAASDTSVRVEIEVVEVDSGAAAGSFDNGPLKAAGDRLQVTGSVPVLQPKLWSPESPFLYQATVRLYADGTLSDILSLRLGMREFVLGKTGFFLNSTPIRLFATLNQQWHAVNFLAPFDEEGFREEMQRLHEGGFNCVRMHIRPGHPRFLDLADEMGIMVYEESPLGWITASEHLLRRASNDIREMVLRDRNHPSLVIWGLFNEGSTRGQAQEDGSSTLFFDETGPGPWAYVKEFVQIFRELDPTRPLSEDSGALHSNRYYVPGEEQARRVLDHHAYRLSPFPDRDAHEFSEYGNPHQMYFVSEYGCAALPKCDDILAKYRRVRKQESQRQGRELPPYQDEAMYAKGKQMWDEFYAESLASFMPSKEETVEQSRRLQAASAKAETEAFRLNPRLAAVTITQLTDAGSEYLGGLTDIFREPKPALQAMRQAQTPVYAAMVPQKSNLYPGEQGTVWVAALNDSLTSQEMVLRVSVGESEEEILYEKPLHLAPGERHTVGVSVPGSANPGTLPVHASLTGPGGEIAHNTVYLQVVDPGTYPAIPAVTVEDVTSDWLHTALAHHLSSRQIPASDDQPLILAAPISDMATLHGEAVERILAAARAGATAVFFGLPVGEEPLPEGERRCFCKQTLFRNEAFDFPIYYRTIAGGFLGHFVFVPPHPVFAGLPTCCVMGPTYKNVTPSWGLAVEGAESILRAFSTPVGYHGVLKRIGCQPTVRLADALAIMPYGTGRLVFSQLDLVPRLGQDPVADRILCNMINWLSGAEGADTGERVMVDVLI